MHILVILQKFYIVESKTIRQETSLVFTEVVTKEQAIIQELLKLHLEVGQETTDSISRIVYK